ncbi:hypothetical protein ACIQVL_21035 [Streptomyces sp. NPDC090499]|uniref:hypothetical protein n=1 Tax=Streptomyces sp. NPDC090499 TaxID=3365965 RepID=UPI0037F591EB
MRVAPHTRVRADRIPAYESAHREAPAEPEKPPANVAWRARMAGLLDVVHDYSEAGWEAGLPVVWELP